MLVDTAHCPFRADCVKKKGSVKFPLMFMGAECAQSGAARTPNAGRILIRLRQYIKLSYLLCFPRIKVQLKPLIIVQGCCDSAR